MRVRFDRRDHVKRKCAENGYAFKYLRHDITSFFCRSSAR
jgi:hypothetical protein